MRQMAAIVCLALVAAPASAQPRREDFTAAHRGNSTAMTCQAAKSFIEANGAAVLTTGPQTYDRYVRDHSFCYNEQTTLPAFTPTRDNPHCFVGYVCEEPQRYFPR